MDTKNNWRRSFCDAISDVALCLFVVAIVSLGASAQTTTEARVRGDAGLYPADGTVAACEAPKPERTRFVFKNTTIEIVERARLKAGLADLLIESLYDDVENKVNVAREREIKQLAKKLQKGGM